MTDDYYFDVETVTGALSEVFPNVSPELRAEMLTKLFEHLFVYAKQTLFTNESEYKLAETVITESVGTPEQKELILEIVNGKMATLSEVEREDFNKKMYEELVKRGNELYRALN